MLYGAFPVPFCPSIQPHRYKCAVPQQGWVLQNTTYHELVSGISGVQHLFLGGFFVFCFFLETESLGRSHLSRVEIQPEPGLLWDIGNPCDSWVLINCSKG